MGLGTGIFQSSVLGLIGLLPPKFIATALFGQGIIGLATNVMALIILIFLDDVYVETLIYNIVLFALVIFLFYIVIIF